MDRRRPDADEHLAIPGDRHVDVPELQILDPAVSVLHDRLHGPSRLGRRVYLVCTARKRSVCVLSREVARPSVCRVPQPATTIRGVDLDAVTTIVRYHAWANERIYETASNVREEDLRRDGAFDHGSALDTFEHMVITDWSWRDWLIDPTVDDDAPWPGLPLVDLPSMRTAQFEEHDRWSSYVASLDEAALNERLSWGNEEEGHVEEPRWKVIFHVVNHGTQHRSELARYLTVCGHSPGDLDIL